MMEILNITTPTAETPSLRIEDVALFKRSPDPLRMPVPVWPYSPSGTRRMPDGVRWMTVAQALAWAGGDDWDAWSLVSVWRACMRERGQSSNLAVLLDLTALPDDEPDNPPPTSAELLAQIEDLLVELRESLSKFSR